MNNFDAVIIGAGAAGMLCAIEAGKRKRRVLIIDHANKAGKKILMSGGGRCNFTNLYISPDRFISHNPHFCKSALSRYTQWDFIELVKKHGIHFHEKTQGQLFCDHKSLDIVNMLLHECEKNHVTVRLNEKIIKIDQKNTLFQIQSGSGKFTCASLVIAAGGLSIPTMGASPFGYQIAQQFGIKVWPTRAGLVPLTLHDKDKEHFSPLSGVSIHAEVSNHRKSFTDDVLLTHRGISGPAILQISSYWQPGENLTINFIPQINLYNILKVEKKNRSSSLLKNILSTYLPKRLITTLLAANIVETKLSDLNHKALEKLSQSVQAFILKPNGTEGYRTAEVTIGGVDCNALSSKTMAATALQNLYFIGEVVDVTGWLGGYNFQWAWSSGFVAGQCV